MAKKPTKKPANELAPRTSPRSPSREEGLATQEQRLRNEREKKESGYAKGGPIKMAKGGKCRGMGAAKKGGSYKG
jgi:hypothetical protein